jgi:hypothetical protein
MFKVGCWKKRDPSTTVGMTECEITKCRERRGPSTSVGMTERGKRREVPPLRSG